MIKEFDIDLDIYKTSIINIWISDFSEVAKIELVYNKLTIKWEYLEEIEEVFLEFSNYLIWLINE